MENEQVESTTVGSSNGHGHALPIGVAPSAAWRLDQMLTRMHEAHQEQRELVKVLRIRDGQPNTLRQLHQVREHQIDVHAAYRRLEKVVQAALMALAGGAA